MYVLYCDQGSQEWTESRLGIPTASQASRIITSKGTPSKSAPKYRAELLSEWVLGEPANDFVSDWMEWGKEQEPRARDFYAKETGRPVHVVGFCYRSIRDVHGGKSADLLLYDSDDPAVGASPDGLVGGEGLLEVKCPSPPIHLARLAGGVVPTEHRTQLQMQLWVTGRQWVDYLSWHPDFPPLLLRVLADEQIQRSLSEALPAFHATLMDEQSKLLQKGVASKMLPSPTPAEDVVPYDTGRDGLNDALDRLAALMYAAANAPRDVFEGDVRETIADVLRESAR